MEDGEFILWDIVRLKTLSCRTDPPISRLSVVTEENYVHSLSDGMYAGLHDQSQLLMWVAGISGSCAVTKANRLHLLTSRRDGSPFFLAIRHPKRTLTA